MPVGESLGKAQRSPLHALVIGIDKYHSELIPDLRGAVADANAVVDYLQTDLHVPLNQITNLRNEEATRDAIIQGFRAFQTRQSIKKGDPILIFFAGHGTTTDAPPGWVTETKSISLLVPYDCLDQKGADVMTHAIPDRTVGALLHELAEPQVGEGKGNNITVIFDCCSSGSGTRRPEYSVSLFERCFDSDEKLFIPSTLDGDIWGNSPVDRATSPLSGYFMTGLSSHVLLAGCSESEHAREGNSRGMFTTVLLEALREVATDKVTYQDLIERIRYIPWQTPQYEGRNTDRILFAAKVPSKGRVVYPVTFKDGQLTLDAGAIHSVTSGARFSIYVSKESAIRDQHFAILEAAQVDSFSTVLKYIWSLDDRTTFMAAMTQKPTPSYLAVQTSMGKVEALRLHIHPSKDQRPVTLALDHALDLQRQGDGPGIVIRKDEAFSHLSIFAHDDHVEYAIRDPLIMNYGLDAQRHTTSAETDRIYAVLNAATHFFWHLRHAPKKSELSRYMKVKMYELMRDPDGELGMDLRRPWTTRSDNLLRDTGHVDIDVADERETPYGLTIESDLELPLHIWVFYFDCNDLSISEYYKPAAIGPGAEPSLPVKGVLPIGFGSGGARPFTYTLKPGQDMDVGFVKIFVSTVQVNLSMVEQRSPFETKVLRSMQRLKDDPVEALWDTLSIAVLQRRKAT
ncbi:hypothetical protein PENSPDRAFT_614510 [Peniophora sp. CONT]|nr:hypothetical protein PENSPDRAFT_614510 [Peniophora sp. CONT]